MTEYKVANVDDLKDGEMKEVVFDAGKALLSKINGEFFATSHLCPHYKAPLSKGTISTDGRVMCPWHGACFRVQTGDIEDGPSVDSLESFKVTVKGGSVYITATEAQVKAGRKKPVCIKSNTAKGETTVIIGGGAGGLVSAETLRKGGYAGKIDAAKVALRTEQDFKDLDIEIRLSTQVTAVDPKEKKVTLSDSTLLKYNSLIIATGGDPRVLPFPGHDLQNIFVMRNVEDANYVGKALEEITDRKPNVVIVGSSFIGMEAASILAKVAKVSVIGMEKYPFERVLGTAVGEAMHKLNTHNGIDLYMEKFVEKYGPSESDPKKVGSVILKGGESIPADFVILGAGVIPKTDYLKSSGIALDKDGGISVSGSMEVPNVTDVYAVGDIARYLYHITGENIRVEHWNVAQNQGRVAAGAILAKQKGESLPGSLEMDSTGGGLSFAVFYLRKGKVVGVCTLAKDPIVSHASELFRLGKMPTGEELKNGKDILSIPLTSSEKFVYAKKEEPKHQSKQEGPELNWITFVAIPAIIVLASTLYLLQGK
ncbi:hypothetical protein HDV04_002923 [Boothiomyces sp. JEL0838]|nr:hypothetical protein HDV04_002923 [Boothiomyces sp. JEL0838]